MVSLTGLYCTRRDRLVCTTRSRLMCTTHSRLVCTTHSRLMCTTRDRGVCTTCQPGWVWHHSSSKLCLEEQEHGASTHEPTTRFDEPFAFRRE